MLLAACLVLDCVAGQNEQVRIALGQPPIRGRGLRVLAMDGGGMKVSWCNKCATLPLYILSLPQSVCSVS